MSWLDNILRRGYGTIQNNGAALPQEYVLNVIGATIVDDPTNARTTMTVSGGGGGGITFGGDLTGTSTSQTVVGMQGHPVSATAPLNGQALIWQSSTPAWTPFSPAGDLGGTFLVTTVTGLQGRALPAPSGSNTILSWSGSALGWITNTAGITQLTGDVTAGPGSGSVAATVVGIQGHAVSSAAPSSGQILIYNPTTWTPTSISGDAALNNTGSLSVTSVHGASVPAAGSLTVGYVLQVSGASSLTYNLLAAASLSPGSGDQLLDTNHGATAAEWFTVGGDLTYASHSFTVVGLQGRTLSSSAPTTGNTLSWGGSSWAPASLNLAGGSGYVTGLLPIGNIAYGTAGEFLVTNSAATAATWVLIAGDITGSTSSPGTLDVASISGSNGGGGTVNLNISTLNWTGAGPWNIGTSNTTGTTAALKIQGQACTTGSQGGTLQLASGTSGTGTAGQILLQLGSSTAFTIWTDAGGYYISSTGTSTNAGTGALRIPYGTTAISAPNSGSTHPMSIVALSGAITVIGDNTYGGGVLLNPGLGTLAVSGFTLGAVVSDGSGNLSSLAPGSANQFLQYNGTNILWASLGITWANDLAGSTNTHQYVAGISGNGGTGGIVTLSDTVHNLSLQAGNASTSTTPTLSITSSNGLGAASVSGAGGTFSITAGNGTVATGGTAAGAAGGTLNLTSGNGANGFGSNQNAGNAGNIVITSGLGGNATGSGASGNGGNITINTGNGGNVGTAGFIGEFTIQLNSVNKLVMDHGVTTASTTTWTFGSGVSNLAWTQATSAQATPPTWNITSAAGYTVAATAGGNGSALTIAAGIGGAGQGTNHTGGTGGAIVIQSGAGGAATGTAANAAGGNITLNTGAGGSGGSGGGGGAGGIFLEIGGSVQFEIVGTGAGSITMQAPNLSGFAAGLLQTNSSGLVITLANGSNTQILTMVAGTPSWAAPAAQVTWASDLVNSTSANQYVSSLSYSSAAGGGTIAINGTGSTLQWASGNTGPLFNQAALGSTSGSSGAAGVTTTFAAQNGQAATGASHNGGAGGNLVLQTGVGGTSGSATAGAAGKLEFQLGATVYYVFDFGVTTASTETLTFGDGTHNDAWVQTTSLQSTPPTFSITTSTGYAAASVSGAGGGLTIATGAATVASSGTVAGAAGGAIAVNSGAGAAGLGSTGGTGSAGGNGGNITITGGAGGAGVIASTNGANGNGGSITLNTGAAGVGGAGGSAGTISLKIAGTTYLSIASSGAVTLANLGTGVVHSTSGGLLSSSIGSADQLYDTNHAGTDSEWFTLGGDATFASHNLTLATVNSNVGTFGDSSHVAQITVNGKGLITAVSNVSISVGGVTWASDLSGNGTSTSSNQYVSSISYSSAAAGGTVAINGTATAFQVASGNTGFVFNQAAQGSTSGGSGAAGSNFTITAQAGQAATGATHNGGAGGNLIIGSGAGGTSGSATAGNAGKVQLQLGGTTYAQWDFGVTTASTTTLTIGDGTHNDAWTQTASIQATPPTLTISSSAGYGAASATGAGGAFTLNSGAGGLASSGTSNGGGGGAFNITAGTGGAGLGGTSKGGAGGAVVITAGNGGASISTSANSNGGNITLTPGSAGTGGSGAAGTAGSVIITGMTTGVVLSASGTLSGLANGSNNQVLTIVSGSVAWAAASGGSVTWANDLSTSSNTAQYVGSISGGSGTAGALALGDGVHNFTWTMVASTTATTPTFEIVGCAGLGSASASGTGGEVEILAGNGTAATSGTAAGGNGGQFQFASGNGSAGLGGNSQGGTGGLWRAFLGAGGAGVGSGSGGSAGTFNVTGSAGGAGGGSGGAGGQGGIITISATNGGAGNGAGAGGAAGTVGLTGGNGGAPGTTGNGGIGGDVTLTSGNGHAGGSTSGNGGRGGNIQLQAGNGGTQTSGTNGAPGLVQLYGGQGGAGTFGGSVQLYAVYGSGTNDLMVEVTDLQNGTGRVVALCQTGNKTAVGITTTNLPSGGDGVVFIFNAQTNPTFSTAPSGGYVLFASGGALKGIGTSGTITTIGPAEPHCPKCGSDFTQEFQNPKYGGTLQVCMKCLCEHVEEHHGEQPWIVRKAA